MRGSFSKIPELGIGKHPASQPTSGKRDAARYGFHMNARRGGCFGEPLNGARDRITGNAITGFHQFFKHRFLFATEALRRSVPSATVRGGR